MTFSRSAIFLSVFLLLPLANANTRVEFSADRIHGLVVFVESISGNSIHADVKRTYEASKFNNPKSKKMIEEFRSLDFALGKEIVSLGVRERNAGRSVKHAILTQASFAKSLPDLRERTVSIMPLPELTKLFKVMSHFETAYDSLLWNPQKAALARVVKDFNRKAATWKLNDLFARASKFYGTDWPTEQKFRVSLFPVPLDSKHDGGTAYGAIASVGINTSNKDLEGYFGNLFHELCHSLYEAQPINLQKQIAESFKKNPSKYSILTSNYLDEALATAIGNGWAYEKAKGKVEAADWYANEKINGLAKSFYPKVKDYLARGKTIDGEFINASIGSFEKLFPESILEFQPVMGNLILLSDGVISTREIRGDLRAYFKIFSISGWEPINDDETLKAVRSVSSTVLAIVTQKQRSQIDSLDDVFKGISEHIELLPANGNYLAMFDIGVRKVIIIILDDPAQVPKAFKIMAQKKKVEKLNSFVELKFQTP